MAYLAASALCIAAIACLAAQRSARLGNTLGLIGVGAGLVATLGALQVRAALRCAALRCTSGHGV